MEVKYIISSKDRKPKVILDLEGKKVQLDLDSARELSDLLKIACDRAEVESLLIDWSVNYFSNLEESELASLQLELVREFRSYKR